MRVWVRVRVRVSPKPKPKPNPNPNPNPNQVVLAAVQSVGCALRYADARLRGEPWVALLAALQDGRALAHASVSLEQEARDRTLLARDRTLLARDRTLLPTSSNPNPRPNPGPGPSPDPTLA